MDIKLYRYRFPFKQSFITASGSFTEREGIIFVLRHDGIEAYGEAAPLPGFSEESMDDILDYLTQNYDSLYAYIHQELTKEDTNKHELLSPLPASLAFGIDTLLADYWSKQKAIPIRHLLFKKSRSTIAVNGTLTIGKTEEVLRQAEVLWEMGYHTVKLKIGSQFDRELALLKRLRNRLPALNIRADANQSWSFDEAADHLARLEPIDIEYCEEPLSHSTPAKLKKLRALSDVPIALDESLYQQRGQIEWIESECTNILIVKPMIMGGLKKIFETCRLASDHEYRIVFTTSLESGIGRMMTAILASGLSSNQFAQGLATGTHLALDVWNDQLYINKGQWATPDKNGLGHQFDPNTIASAIERLDN